MDFLQQLKELKPTPKPFMPWPMHRETKHDHQIVGQLIRVTRCLPVDLRYLDDQWLASWMSFKPDVIAVHAQVFNRLFRNKPWTTGDQHVFGDRVKDNLDYLYRQARIIKDIAGDTPIVCLLEYEGHKEPLEWNPNSLVPTEGLAALYLRLKSVFRGEVMFFNYGAQDKRNHVSPVNPHVPSDLRFTGLYFAPGSIQNEDRIAFTYGGTPDLMRYKPIAVSVCLGTQWTILPPGKNGKPNWTWSFEQPQQPGAMAQMGYDLMRDTRIKHVFAWPGPFDDRIEKAREHFLAFVRGAHG